MLPWIIALAGTALSGTISWYFTRRYYLKAAKEANESNREMETLIRKLPEEFLTKLKNDKRESLSVKEMNELIELKTVDKNKTGVEAFKACPKCGASNIEIFDDHEADVEGKYGEEPTVSIYPYKIVRCLNCDWEKSDFNI